MKSDSIGNEISFVRLSAGPSAASGAGPSVASTESMYSEPIRKQYFREILLHRDGGSIIKVGGAHRLSGTLAGFLEVRLSTFSERGKTLNDMTKHCACWKRVYIATVPNCKSARGSGGMFPRKL